MKLPRWTTYPALAVLLVIAIVALPQGKNELSRGAAQRARSQRVALTPGSSATDQKSFARSVVEFLPAGYVMDGSVDYRAQVQQAIDAAAGGTLHLPDFPIRVGATPGQRYALIVRSGMTLLGSPSSELVTTQGAIQVLRAENPSGLVFEGFTVRGIGSGGHSLAHGLVQVTGGQDVRVEGLLVQGADADGIAIANARGASLVGNTVEGASKSSLYLSNCEGGVVRGNIVRDFGGHSLGGNRIGAGIQLSSNQNVVCSDNVISEGVGVGILCNANSGGAKPGGNILRGNRIENVSNPTNMNVSGGIRCTNSAADKATSTLITGNSLRGCGVYGLYIENHGGSAILGNLIVESVRTGILVSSIQDLQILDNVVLNSDASQNGGQAAIYLLNNAERVRCQGNVTRNTSLLGSARALETVKDTSRGGGHSLEPRIDHASSPPTQGNWNTGDIIYNSRPSSGAQVGWVCTSPGSPGIWSGFGTIQ